VYAERLAEVRERVEHRGKASTGPAAGVRLIRQAVSADRPRTRYANGVVGAVLPKVRRLVPDRLFDQLALRATTGQSASGS